MPQITLEQINNWFTYHAPTPAQVAQYAAIRESAKQLAVVILQNTPPGPDQSAAFRLLRETVMTANASIACSAK